MITPFIFVSDSVEDVTGYPATELDQGRLFTSIIDSRDSSWVKEVMKQDIDSSRPYSMEYRIVRKDGGFDGFGRGRAQYDNEGVPQSLDGVILDVTERRKAEEEHLRTFISWRPWSA